MKKILLSTLAFFVLAPAVALAETPTPQRFDHEGRSYRYTVSQTGGTRVITGVEEKTGKPFRLRVGKYKVRGTVGTQQVSFSLRHVEPLTLPSTTLAAR